MNGWKLEPEFETSFLAYKDLPDPVNASALMDQLNPVLDQGIRAHVGNSTSPTMRSHARQIALQAVRTYDPVKSRLSTHVINHLQGLKRVQQQTTGVLSVPERVILDQRRIATATSELEDRYGREPTLSEIADYTGLSPKRLQHVRGFKSPVSESQMTEHTGTSGETQGFDPRIASSSSNAWLEVVYDDLNPYSRKIMEWTLGMHGQPMLSNKEIAVKLGLSPGAVSQRKAQIQGVIDQEQRLSPFN